MRPSWRRKRLVKPGGVMLWRGSRLSRLIYAGIILISFVGLTYFYLVDEVNSTANGISTSRLKPGLLVQKIVSFAEDFLNQVTKHSCPNLTLNHDSSTSPNLNIINLLWQRPVDTELYIFSAYYDQRYQATSGRRQHFVRIIAIHNNYLTREIYCQLWYDNQTEPLVLLTDTTEIWSNVWDRSNNNYYRPYLISCPIPSDISEKKIYPIGISVSSKACEKSKTFIKLEKPPSNSDSLATKKFAICVKGLDFDEDLSSRLVEWIEMQIMLGVDSISFYIFHVHPNMVKVLKHYATRGIAVLRDLTLPGNQPNVPILARSEFLKKNIWQKRRHELVPYNDCLYSRIYTHAFLALLDIDEIIVPMQELSWTEMFKDMAKTQPNVLETFASLSVSNLYFFDEFGASNDRDIPPSNYVLRHIHRSANFSRPGFACKSFFQTNLTLMAFNHYVLTPLYSSVRRSAVLSPNIARLHHYRTGCPVGMQKECDSNFMKFTQKDVTMWRWRERLVEKTQETLKLLGL